MKVTLNVHVEKGEGKDELISASINMDKEVAKLSKEDRHALLVAATARLVTHQANEMQKELLHSLEVLQRSQSDIVQALSKGMEVFQKNQSEFMAIDLKVFQELGKQVAAILSHNDEMSDRTEDIVKKFTVITDEDDDDLDNGEDDDLASEV